jgi:phage tail-like protein
MGQIETIGMFMHCSGLEVTFDTYDYHEGGNNEFVHRLPGVMRYTNLVLTRGMTNEDALLKWLWATKTKAERKQVTLTLNAGQASRTWTFADAFPVRWTGPQIDTSSHDIATETLEIAHSGLQMT